MLAALLSLAAGCRPDIAAPMAGINPETVRSDAAGDMRDGPRIDGGAETGAGGAAKDGALPDAAGAEAPAGNLDSGQLAPGDAPAIDAPPVVAADPPADGPAADLPIDAPPVAAGCGSEAPDLSLITNIDALTIGRDGTLYFAQSGTPNGWIGRLRPGGAAAELRWVSVPNGATLWGLATDDARQRLYISSASGHVIHYVATAAAQPTLQVLTRDVDEPDDLAVGPGGTIFFPDSDNHIYRVTPGGELERVTSGTFGGNRSTAVAFSATGQLLVGTLGNGPIHRLSLTSGAETMRGPFGSFRGFAVSLAVDSQGGVLAINQVPGSESQVLRFGADGVAGAVVATGPALTAMAFGRGALSCRDLYLASKTGPMRRASTGIAGPPAP